MKFSEIREASGKQRNELEQLQYDMEVLKDVEVTWDDVEAGRETKNAYATWRRRYNKVSDAAMKIEIQDMNVEREVEREQRLSVSTDPKVQEMADRFHDLTCTWDHTERCGYHYGNWDNDIRSEMLDAYKRVSKAIDKLSFRGLKDHLDAVEQGSKAKAALEKF